MEGNDAINSIRIVEHMADWALHIRGQNLADLFRLAALGMAGLLVSDLPAIQLDVKRVVHLEAYDSEDLLVQWLSELAFWAEQESLVFREFEMPDIAPTMLNATVRGGHADHLQKHIKAVTYHNLAIRPANGGLEVTIVFDV
jgi:SHS2 domain-containing protein